jgi:dTDP-4-amino-4,6-dideoxygalactose transaminase
VIRVKQQVDIHKQLRASGIETVLHYSPPIYHYSVYRDGLLNAQNLPVTDRLATELVNLPVAPELTDEDVAYVLEVLHQLLD